MKGFYRRRKNGNCTRCEGTGNIELYKDKFYEIIQQCHLCNGNKNSDWVDKIFQTDQLDVTEFIHPQKKFLWIFSVTPKIDHISIKKYPDVYIHRLKF